MNSGCFWPPVVVICYSSRRKSIHSRTISCFSLAVGTGTVPGPSVVPVNPPSLPDGSFPAQRVYPRACAAQYSVNTPGGPSTALEAPLSVLLSLSLLLGSKNSNLLGLPRLLVPSAPLGKLVRLLPCLLSVPCSGNHQALQMGTSFASCLSGITSLHCLMSRILKTVVSGFCLLFLGCFRREG